MQNCRDHVQEQSTSVKNLNPKQGHTDSFAGKSTLTDRQSTFQIISKTSRPALGRSVLSRCLPAVLLGMLPMLAEASMFKGEALDTVADIMAWVVLVVAPLVGITVFWLVHILPEKIAEKRQHPQAKAIQVLCILSLFFGGMLWPLAWLMAYTKPVLHKLAYGTDKAPHGAEHIESAHDTDDAAELKRLRQQVIELKSRLADTPETGKV
jgi:CBS domain containing-hemolysin-like protein